ncbi:lipoyl(octanoyl) transferase LipB [Chloroflexota bacterium]
MNNMSIIVYQPGLTEYKEASTLQKSIRHKVIKGEAEDTLLLLEHPPTITIGKSGKPENVLVSEAELAGQGISIFFTERGGDVTFHGPGQLVAYPILDLNKRGRNGHKYVYDLEETVLRTLSDLSITGSRDESHAGIWVNNNEIAAIGISLSKWVTMHGIALNVNIDLQPFSLIYPCGFTDRKATSISELLSREIPVKEVTERFLAHFAEIFETDFICESIPQAKGGSYE